LIKYPIARYILENIAYKCALYRMKNFNLSKFKRFFRIYCRVEFAKIFYLWFLFMIFRLQIQNCKSQILLIRDYYIRIHKISDYTLQLLCAPFNLSGMCFCLRNILRCVHILQTFICVHTHISSMIDLSKVFRLIW